MNDIKVPMTIELRAGDVVVAVIEDDPAVFSLVLQHAIAYDRQAKAKQETKDPQA